LNKDDLSLWKKVQSGQKLDVDKLFRAEIDGAAALKGPGARRPRNPQDEPCLLGQPIPNTAQPMILVLRCLDNAQCRFKMDLKSFGKLKRGDAPERPDRDLHGMTLETRHACPTQIHPRSYAKGRPRLCW